MRRRHLAARPAVRPGREPPPAASADGVRASRMRPTRLLVCRTMDEPDRSPSDRQPVTGDAPSQTAADATPEDWMAVELPRPPFVDPTSPIDSPRIAPLTPR